MGSFMTAANVASRIVSAEQKIVNVASVPLRSPFRYPGGKTWLVPLIREWMKAIPSPGLFVEPFAGGWIISLTVAAEGLAPKVLMGEVERGVAAVWRSILGNDFERLARLILKFEISREATLGELSRTP